MRKSECLDPRRARKDLDGRWLPTVRGTLIISEQSKALGKMPKTTSRAATGCNCKAATRTPVSMGDQHMQGSCRPLIPVDCPACQAWSWSPGNKWTLDLFPRISTRSDSNPSLVLTAHEPLSCSSSEQQGQFWSKLSSRDGPADEEGMVTIEVTLKNLCNARNARSEEGG